MRNLALLADGFMNWTGGIDFFTTNLVALLKSYDPKHYQITILFPEKKFFSSRLRLLLRLPLIKQLIWYLKIKKNPWFAHFEKAHIRFVRFGKKRINRQLKVLRADLALFCWSDTQVDIPAIGYYPDLQHKHYPDFFTQKECVGRDQTIKTILSQRETVLVNSFDTKKDLEHFFPGFPAKICHLPFSPVVMNNAWLDPLIYDVKKKYGITAPYFMISNQFWIHKEHKTALRALAKLSDVHLVCTGGKDDYRSPGYYEKLLELIEKLGIQDRVHLLGYIPKREQVELMKESVAVIQPSLFEGGPGGGSINTAVALGVPSLLSAIPVNLEVKGDKVSFFEVKNSADLSLKMEACLKNTYQRPSKEVLLEKSEQNLRQLGEALFAAVKDVL